VHCTQNVQNLFRDASRLSKLVGSGAYFRMEIILMI